MTAEAETLEREILAHVRALVPELLDEPGVGPIVAAQLIVSWSFHRRQHDPATRDYITRRLSEGKTSRDAVRLLKRYLARHLYRVMQNSTPLTT
jgi:transposase